MFKKIYKYIEEIKRNIIDSNNSSISKLECKVERLTDEIKALNIPVDIVEHKYNYDVKLSDKTLLNQILSSEKRQMCARGGCGYYYIVNAEVISKYKSIK